MNPIQKYLGNLFAKKRIIGDDAPLNGLVKADAILSTLVNEKKVPGLAITVLKDGKNLFQKGYGHSDLESRTAVSPTQTLFRIASISKPIAATALAQMVIDFQIDLDASFYKYVPYYPKKKWDFTIRQLASHTAGIRGYKGVEYGLNHPHTIKEGTAVFKDDDLIFQPGRGYCYTSFGWTLVSLAMQEASGIPFETYVRQNVLTPLRMENTFAPTLSEGGSTLNKLTTFYSKSGVGFRRAIPVNNYYKLAGGGYLSTSEDISKLGQAYLDGIILSEEIRSEFVSSQFINDKPTFYGLGWQVSEDSLARPFYGHIGNGVGGYSNFFVYPDEGMVIVILINCTDPKVQPALDEVVRSLLGEIQ